MKKKMSMLLCGALLAAAGAANAGNIPEFDAVGDDSANYFATSNLGQYGAVVANNIGDPALGPINEDSDFTRVVYETIYSPAPHIPNKYVYGESFNKVTNQLKDDVCFGEFKSALTTPYQMGKYSWSIVLQMEPESDINVNVYDCVLKHNQFTLWGAAEQTGRWREPNGQLFFLESANPSITVTAISGPNNPNLPFKFVMDGRTMPTLTKVALKDAKYTSKALWSEAIVAELPETGKTNLGGEPVYNLVAGDRIVVDITIPRNNSVDLRYGADSVIAKYIGVVGTEFYASLILPKT